MEKFNFFISYYEAASELPDKQRLAFYDAIMEYIFKDVTPELTGLANTFWGLTMPYLRKSKANSGNGGKAKRKAKYEANTKRNDSEVLSEIEANTKRTAKRISNETLSETDSEPRSETASNKKLEVEVDFDFDGDTGGNIPPITPPAGGEVNTAPSEPEPFDLFWTAYPRKVGKGAARKAWAKIKPGKVLVGKILSAVEFAKASVDWRRENGRFIPHPATWLNQDRWDDELAPGKGATDTEFNPDRTAGFHNAFDYSEYDEAIWDGPDDDREGNST
jgi:hypothetical protein